MKKMLITGGAGFIGVNAARYFASRGWGITIFDNFSRKGAEYNIEQLEKDLPGKFAVVRGDIRNEYEQLKKLAGEHDVILHLAAQVAVTTSVANPREDFECNALGTINLLEAIRTSGNKPFLIYASTNKVYGALENVPVKEGTQRYEFAGGLRGVPETQQLDFHSPYGCSKGAADQYVHDYSRIYGLPTVVFRQSCIYGPHQMGVEDQGWVAWFLIAGLFNRPITIYGNGKQVRDLLYIDDLMECYKHAIDHRDIASGKIYNLGGGQGNTLSLLEFIGLLKHEHGLTLSHSFAETRQGDQPIFISDNTAAERDLQWKPTTGVGEGIANLLEWLREHRDGLEQFYSQECLSTKTKRNAQAADRSLQAQRQS